MQVHTHVDMCVCASGERQMMSVEGVYAVVGLGFGLRHRRIWVINQVEG